MTDFLHQQMPKLFPALDLDEGTGDSWDLDDADCAAEGTAQPGAVVEVPNRLPQLVALTMRVRRLESALDDVNNYAQVLTFRLEALERAQKRQAAEQATALAQESREIAAALELAS